MSLRLKHDRTAREPIHSMSEADYGPSPRASFSSQSPSSVPMRERSSPDSSMNHATTPSSSAAPSHAASRNRDQQGYFSIDSRLRHSNRYSSDHGVMSPLAPPTAPFAQGKTGSGPSAGSVRTDSLGSSIAGINGIVPSRSGSPSNIAMLSASPSSGLDSGNVSLSVNYLPSKFSSSMLNKELDEKGGGTRRRKARRTGKNVERLLKIPKMGGGVEAFRAGESRIGEDEDEDYRHGVGRDVGSTRGSQAFLASLMFWKRSTVNNGNPSKSMRWNRFKSALFISNAILTIYSFSSFVVCLLLWFDAWTHVDVIRVGNRPELVISTLASSMGLFTCLVGWAGTVTNNRRFLAIYNLLLWITFVFMIIPGYITYKRRTFNLEGKINSQWSRNLGSIGRLRIQNQLSCCGYFSPFVEATVSQVCYSRSILPGCKKPYLDFEKEVLRKWYTAVFAIVPFHIIVIVVGLLCSNHVTYRFGKGMMPKRYRLSMGSMAVIMENYAQQLVEQYGTDIASSAFAHSRSQAKLLRQDLIPTVAYLDHIGSSKTMLGTVTGQEKGYM